jgi:hypothetical protein
MSASITATGFQLPVELRNCACARSGLLSLFNRTISAPIISDIINIAPGDRRVEYGYSETTAMQSPVFCQGFTVNGSRSFGMQFAVTCQVRQGLGAGVTFDGFYAFDGCASLDVCNGCAIGLTGPGSNALLTEVSNPGGIDGLRLYCPGGPGGLTYSATAELRFVSGASLYILGPGSFSITFS